MKENIEAVLHAAHVIETYCKWKSCDACPFRIAPFYCLIETNPTKWNIEELKKELEEKGWNG